MPLWLLSLKNPRHAERPWALHQPRSMCLAAQKGWIGIHLRTVLATLAACLRSLANHRTGGTDKLHCYYKPQQLFQNTNPTIILLSPRTIQQRQHWQRNPLKKKNANPPPLIVPPHMHLPKLVVAFEALFSDSQKENSSPTSSACEVTERSDAMPRGPSRH